MLERTSSCLCTQGSLLPGLRGLYKVLGSQPGGLCARQARVEGGPMGERNRQGVAQGVSPTVNMAWGDTISMGGAPLLGFFQDTPASEA